ncbi:hypothetical protein [Corynebacterium belfantii]
MEIPIWLIALATAWKLGIETAKIEGVRCFVCEALIQKEFH